MTFGIQNLIGCLISSLLLVGCFSNGMSAKRPRYGSKAKWISPRMEQCNSRGYVWVALVDGGKKPSRCAEFMAKHSCGKEDLLNSYPNRKKDIQTIFDRKLGHRLYNCGFVEGMLTMHFYQESHGKVSYQVFSVKTK